MTQMPQKGPWEYTNWSVKEHSGGKSVRKTGRRLKNKNAIKRHLHTPPPKKIYCPCNQDMSSVQSLLMLCSLCMGFLVCREMCFPNKGLPTRGALEPFPLSVDTLVLKKAGPLHEASLTSGTLKRLLS